MFRKINWQSVWSSVKEDLKKGTMGWIVLPLAIISIIASGN